MRTLLRIALLFLFLSGFLTRNNQVNAQGYNFDFSFDSGNPGGLNATSDTATVGWAALTTGGEATNAWSVVQTLPFAFNYYGSPVTQYKVSRNGLLTFNTGTALLPNSNTNLPSNSLPNSTIAAFWDEFTTSPPLPANSRVYVRTFGTIGSRQFWIKWTNFEIGNPTASFANFALVLEEGTDNVYIVDMNYASSNVRATVGLQNTTTDAIQFGTSTMAFRSTTSGPSAGNNDYYEFTPQQTVDVGIEAITAPAMPLASGTSNVVVTLKNYSQITINSLLVQWSINGVPQPDFVWTGTLNPNASLPNVVIGSYNFRDAQTYAINICTSDPNGLVDVDASNDCASKTNLCPMLLGNYTVGGTGADFATIQDAVAALQCAGVEAATRFTLNAGSGPYSGQFTFGTVPNASALNTITFSGGATKEKITGTGLYTIQLNGADHFIFENLTLENLSVNTSTVVQLTNRADNNIFRNNIFEIKAGSNSASTNFTGILISDGVTGTGTPGHGHNNLIQNNIFNNGTTPVFMRSTAASLDAGNQVIGNTMNNVFAKGVVATYQSNPTVRGNTINLAVGSTNTIGIDFDRVEQFTIDGNKILTARIGIELGNTNILTGNAGARGKIVNNMITNNPGSFGDGITFIAGSNWIDILHNSISMTQTTSDGIGFFTGSNIRILNNSIALYNNSSNFNAAVNIGNNGLPGLELNYNNYFITGSGFVITLGNADYSPANFIGAGGHNLNSHYGDPGYINPLSDLHAGSGQLNDKGSNAVGVLTDIDGDARPIIPGGTVDIGADEFILFAADVAVTEITAPARNGRILTSNALTNSENVSITVVNTGGSTQSNIPVFFKVNNTVSAQETIPGPLTPGQRVTYTFTQKANLAAVGNYNISAYAALAADLNQANDTISGLLIRQLTNDPVTVFPVFEDFESAATVTFRSDYVGLPGAEKLDFDAVNVNPTSRLRTFAGSGFAKSGLKAATLDKTSFTGGGGEPASLIMTLNLANYTTTDIILLDFSFVTHFGFNTTLPGDKVYIRGNDGATWIQVYDWFANRNPAGVYKDVTGINLSNLLSAAGQTFSTSTQIRFAHDAQGPTNSVTCCDGVSFDDIRIRRLLRRDLTATTLTAPTPNICGDSTQDVTVTVKNLGVDAQSNIPVSVIVSGPVNTTLTGIVAGPLTTDQTATIKLGEINTYAGGSFTFKSFTSLLNDERTSNDTLTSVVFINQIPDAPTVANTIGCEGDPVTLNVTGAADSYNFYSAPNAGSLLTNSTTGTYTTPALTATTTYYVSAINTTSVSVGMPNNQATVNGGVNLYTSGLQFNVLREAIIDTVSVYPLSAGIVRINVVNASGVTIATKAVNVTTPNIKTKIALGFRIPAGTNYVMQAVGSTVSGLSRNTGTASLYPFTIPQTISITQSNSGGTNFYYFFYDWKLTVPECESARVPLTVTVYPKPIVNLGADIKNCTGGPVTLDAGNGGFGYTYMWSNSETNQTISVTTSGSYFVTVTNPLTGCKATDTINVQIGTAPVVNLGPAIVQCGGTVILDAGNPGFDYIWSPGSLTSQTITVSASGNYSVTVIDPASGCSTSASVSVTINPTPVVALGADVTQCGGTVTLDAGNAGMDYLWSNGATTKTIIVSASGNYSVTVTNPTTMCTGTDAVDVTINSNPVVDLGADVTQCGGTVTLDAGNAGMNYLWSNGATTQTIIVSVSGNYSVTVTDPATTCSATDAALVTINTNPIVALGTDITQCGGTVTLDAGNAGMNYLWSNGATTQTISVSGSGTYSVVVTNPTTTCTGTDAIDVTINPTPVVALGPDVTQCAGTVTLDAGNAGSGFTYLWSNGATSQTITVSASGNYSVTVTNPTTTCSATDAAVVTINSNPVVALGTDITQCGGTVTLDAGNAGMNYLWSNGATTQTITVSASGNYSVVVTNPATTCTGTDAIDVTINPTPVVNLGADVTQCAGTVTLDAGNAGMNYLWSNGATTQTITVSTSGNYSVVVTNPATMCTGTDAAVVTINPNLTVALGTDITQCGGTVMLDAGNAGMNYLWSNGATTQTITVSASGTYSVVVTNPTTTCTGTDAIDVTINPNPVVALGADVTQCGGTVTLDAGNAGMNYLWSNGATSQTITVSASGTYSVVVTNPTTTCSGTDAIDVTINPNLTVALGPDITQCGGTVTLDAGNAGMNYLWSNGATTQTITVSASGTYSVVVTNPATTCTGTDAIDVTINANPIVALGPDVTQCAGTVTLDAGNAGMNYLWSTGATTQTITAATSGTYSVTVTNPTTMCTGTDDVVVTITPSLTVNLGADVTQCDGTVTLDAGNPGMSYLWSNGATTQTITASASGTYSVTVSNATCTGTDAVTVTINNSPIVNFGPDVILCAGTTALLDAGNPGMNYLWSNGATTQTISVTTSGTYSVVVTNPTTTCTGTDAVDVTFTPLPATPTITVMGATLTSSAATGNQWYFNGAIIPGATSQNHTVTSNGDYTVQVTENGCLSLMSAITVYNTIGITDALLNAQVSVYPNPTAGSFNVTLTNTRGTAIINLYSITGQLLATEIVKADMNSEISHNFDLTNKPTGIYLLKLETQGKVAYRKVVKE